MPELRVGADGFDETFPLHLSGEQASQLLSMSYPTFKKLAEKGYVKAQKVNDRWQVDTRSLFSYLGLESKLVVTDG